MTDKNRDMPRSGEGEPKGLSLADIKFRRKAVNLFLGILAPVAAFVGANEVMAQQDVPPNLGKTPKPGVNLETIDTFNRFDAAELASRQLNASPTPNSIETQPTAVPTTTVLLPPESTPQPTALPTTDITSNSELPPTLVKTGSAIVNLRDGTKLSSKIETKIPPFTELTVSGVADGDAYNKITQWLAVTYTDAAGHVFNGYISGGVAFDVLARQPAQPELNPNDPLTPIIQTLNQSPVIGIGPNGNQQEVVDANGQPATLAEMQAQAFNVNAKKNATMLQLLKERGLQFDASTKTALIVQLNSDGKPINADSYFSVIAKQGATGQNQTNDLIVFADFFKNGELLTGANELPIDSIYSQKIKPELLANGISPDLLDQSSYRLDAVTHSFIFSGVDKEGKKQDVAVFSADQWLAGGFSPSVLTVFNQPITVTGLSTNSQRGLEAIATPDGSFLVVSNATDGSKSLGEFKKSPASRTVNYENVGVPNALPLFSTFDYANKVPGISALYLQNINFTSATVSQVELVNADGQTETTAKADLSFTIRTPDGGSATILVEARTVTFFTDNPTQAVDMYRLIDNAPKYHAIALMVGDGKTALNTVTNTCNNTVVYPSTASCLYSFGALNNAISTAALQRQISSLRNNDVLDLSKQIVPSQLG